MLLILKADYSESKAAGDKGTGVVTGAVGKAAAKKKADG